MSKRWAIASVVRAVDTAARTVTAYASTGVMDRHGTVIEPAAFKKAMKPYLANPVVLAAHSHWFENGEPPVIGKVTGWSIDEKGLLVTIEFARGGMADLYWARYADGFMRAFSVGFRPTKTERRQREDKSGEYAVFLEVELYEISAVAVPSNPEALCTKDVLRDVYGAAALIEHDDIRVEPMVLAGDQTIDMLTRAYEVTGTPRTAAGSRDRAGVAPRASDAVDAVQGQPDPVVARTAETRLDAVEVALRELRVAIGRLDAAERRLAELNRDMDDYFSRGAGAQRGTNARSERTPAMPGVF